MKNLRILYFDTDDYFGNQVKIRLQWKGYKVTTTDSEFEFITKKEHSTYDLLIIDLFASEIAAFSLLENLKNIPTIVISTDKNYHQIIQAMKLGCIDYVIKSPIAETLVEQLSLSIWQLFSSSQKENTNHKNKKNNLDVSEKPLEPNISNWQYLISEDIIQWSAPQHRKKSTLSYEKFIAKIHQDDLAHVQTQNNICLFSHDPVTYKFRFISNSNRETTFYAKLQAAVTADGSVEKLYGTMQAQPSQQLQNPCKHLEFSFLDNTIDAVFITNSNKQIISINNEFTKTTGYSAQEILQTKADFLNTDKFDSTFFMNVAEELKNKNFWQDEILIRHCKGHTIPVIQSSYVLKDSTGNILQSLSILKDISKQKSFEESIKFQANYDPLTELPNRTLFIDRLTSTIKLSKRNNSKLALILLDLNKFKWINDTLGHHAGDVLLQETAKMLLSSVRSSDTVARLGGDEFSIILPELEKSTDAELIASKIFNAFKKSIYIDQKEVFISGSIGITIFPDDGHDLETLQKNADSAMYIAKKNGDNSYYYFTQALQEKTEKRLKLIEDLRQAITNKEFTLHYQPIIDLKTNKVVSAETLLRWNHPQKGYIAVSDFISTADECGLMRQIGNWVIEEVATNIQRWESLNFPPLHISLNQSVAQYSLSECHIEWLDILKKKQISPSNITFEISEKLFLEEKTNYLTSIKKLKQAGIQISLDSFGTGYSSLSYLEKFPVDVIKIDRSYIHNMIENPTNAVLVETIIFLANKLQIKVIATGVENKKQLSLLEQQCRYAQGYYFSKPLSLSEFETYIHKHN